MSGRPTADQAIDLRLVRSALHRHRRLVALTTILGAAVGVGIASLTPPSYTGTSLIIFDSPSIATTPGSRPLVLDVDTHAEIARSDAVLERAIERTDADLAVGELRGHVRTSTPTTSLVKVDVADPEENSAIALAEAIAEAHVEYVEEASAPVLDETQSQLELRIAELSAQADGLDDELAQARQRQANNDGSGEVRADEAELIAMLTGQRAEVAVELNKLREQLEAVTDQAPSLAGINARVVPDAGTAVRPSLALRGGLAGFAGAVVGFLAGGLVAWNAARRERTIWSTDLLTRALGSPIVAGLASRPRRSPAAWQRLLTTYDPPPVDSWAVRRALRGLGHDASLGLHRASGRPGGDSRTPAVISVIALSSDPLGQSLGPVLAASAASLNRQTAVLGVGDPVGASSLWAGLALYRRQPTPRENLTVVQSADEAPAGSLLFALTVVDPTRASFDLLPPSAVTLLCIGPGAATVDELSRLALRVDAAGKEISAVVVADPEDWESATPSLGAATASVEAITQQMAGLPPPDSSTTATARGRP